MKNIGNNTENNKSVQEILMPTSISIYNNILKKLGYYKLQRFVFTSFTIKYCNLKDLVPDRDQISFMIKPFLSFIGTASLMCVQDYKQETILQIYV